MKLIAAFVLVASLSQQQLSLAQDFNEPPILLAQHQTIVPSPFVSRPTIRYATSPQTSYAAAPASGYSAPGVVTYQPATPYTGSQTVYRLPTSTACPAGCTPAPATYTARPALPLPYASPYTPPPAAIPAGYYTGRGIIGQPKLYATGQPIRNVLRFLTY